MVNKYVKRPVEVEAIQLCWTNWNEICDFIQGIVSPENPARNTKEFSDKCGEPGPDYIEFDIPTLEGKMLVRHGDYIIKGVEGEFYPCKPDIFHKTYKIVNKSLIQEFIDFAKRNEGKQFLKDLKDKSICLSAEIQSDNININQACDILNSELEWIKFYPDENDPIKNTTKYKIVDTRHICEQEIF